MEPNLTSLLLCVYRLGDEVIYATDKGVIKARSVRDDTTRCFSAVTGQPVYFLRVSQSGHRVMATAGHFIRLYNTYTGKLLMDIYSNLKSIFFKLNIVNPPPLPLLPMGHFIHLKFLKA